MREGEFYGVCMRSQRGPRTAPGSFLADQALRGIARLELVVQAEAMDVRVRACAARAADTGSHERAAIEAGHVGLGPLPMRSIRVRSFTVEMRAPAIEI